jgi:hypothetical protein
MGVGNRQRLEVIGSLSLFERGLHILGDVGLLVTWLLLLSPSATQHYQGMFYVALFCLIKHQADGSLSHSPISHHLLLPRLILPLCIVPAMGEDPSWLTILIDHISRCTEPVGAVALALPIIRTAWVWILAL